MANYDRLNKIGFDYMLRKIKTYMDKKQNKSIYLENVVVPVTNWGTESSNYSISEEYKYYFDIIINGCIETMLPDVVPSQVTADMGILSVNCQSMTGKLRIYASAIPTSVLNFKLIKLERTE
ncbi:hypothetical protein [Anaerorhabdus sp.]|uniref:hypothetical protein n=1 Tax=Anaerorhabdus sp. TaxID=1872524 RepID=UPI002FC92325